MKTAILVLAAILVAQQTCMSAGLDDPTVPVNPPVHLRDFSAHPVHVHAPTDQELRMRQEFKLDKIHIPEVNLHDVTIQEAVRFLREASKANDISESNSRERGVNFILRTFSVSPHEGSKNTIILKNVSLRETLNRIADAWNTAIIMDPYGVVVAR